MLFEIDLRKMKWKHFFVEFKFNFISYRAIWEAYVVMEFPVPTPAPYNAPLPQKWVRISLGIMLITPNSLVIFEHIKTVRFVNCRCLLS